MRKILVFLAALLVATAALGQTVGWNGWQSAATASLATQYVSPQANADVAINAAINALSAKGGGVVALGAGTYTWSSSSSPVPLKSGIYVVGAVPILNYTTNTSPIPDASNVLANGGGTILNCGGGPCFQWAKAVLGVPGSANAFTIAGITNAGIKNIGFTNCSRAVDAGNTNNPGGWYLEFENLYISGCTDWGFWVTNFMHTKFRKIWSIGNATGQMFFGNDVPSSILQPGNSVWEDLYANTPSTNTNLSRGCVWFVTQGQQNEGMLSRIQCNRNGASVVTQAATMSNGSANIAVTDGTKFAINMPVSFSASVNGVTANEIYFVLTDAANVLTVSLTIGGAAVSMTGATAVNITTSGFAAMEIVAASGAALSSHDFNNIDVENGGTCAIVAQNVQTSKIEISQVPSTAQSTQSICGRSLQNSQVFARGFANTSFDGNSGTTQFYGNRATGSVNHNPPGIYYDQTLNYVTMNLSASVMGWSNQTPDGSNMLIPKTGMVSQLENKAAAAVTLVGADSGVVVNAYTVGTATWTLPTCSSTVKGMMYRLVNPVGTGQNLVATSASNFWGPATGRTSITETPGSSMDVVCENDALGSYLGVGNLVGSYSAGTLTGITP